MIFIHSMISASLTVKISDTYWRTIGKFDIPEPEIREMKPAEMVHVRRRLRKIAPKKHFIQKAFCQQGYRFTR